MLGGKQRLPGQGCVLHLDSWEESPGHGRPPLLVDGLSHRRMRDRWPPPQEAEHSPHSCHEPQLPSTATKYSNGCCNFVCATKGNSIFYPKSMLPHRGSLQCCTSVFVYLHQRTLSRHWQVWDCHTSCSASSDLRYTSYCSCPSYSTDPSYHLLRRIKSDL